jgi:RHS repeat-associated protein
VYGNLCEKTTGRNTTRYHYNSAGLLIRVVHPDITETRYTYDSYRRRIVKEHDGITTEYLWEQDRLVRERIGDFWQRVYIYGRKEDLTPCAFTDLTKKDGSWDGESYAVHTDHLGTPFSVSNSKGDIVWDVEFLPYGEIQQLYKNEITFNFRLPGQYFDEETGLHYNRHRYYDPGFGRYITPDPIGVSGGINLYVYTQNPLKEVDFLGLSKKHGKNKEEGNRPGKESVTKKGDATDADLAKIRVEDNPKSAAKKVKVSKSKYPESYEHAKSTGNEIGPFTVDRQGRNARRRANLKGKDKVSGKDLDEFPPAVTKEGDNASVRPIDRSDNRGSGSTMGHQIKDLNDGDKFEYDWTH